MYFINLKTAITHECRHPVHGRLLYYPIVRLPITRLERTDIVCWLDAKVISSRSTGTLD